MEATKTIKTKRRQQVEVQSAVPSETDKPRRSRFTLKHPVFSKPVDPVKLPNSPEPLECDFAEDPEDMGVNRVPAFCFTPATHLPISEESTAERHFFPSPLDLSGRISTETAGELGEELLQAARKNSVEEIRSLLDSDLSLSPNYHNYEGWTALHIAAHRGFLQICEVLLDYGDRTNINAKTCQMQTPLHLACQGNFKPVVQTLVRAGANLNVVDSEGNSPLHLAVLAESRDIVHWLLVRGPDLNIRNYEGKTPADLAKNETLGLFVACLRVRDPSPLHKIPITSSRRDEVSHMLTRVRHHSGHSLSNLDLDTIAVKKPSPLDFEALQLLGKGSFGEVYLVQKLDTLKLYAMKVLPKEKILSQNLVRYAMTERNVLSYVKHPFIVGLQFAFQTAEKLFLILDYCPGGDLAFHLQREKRFSEYRTRIYLAEVILAIEELHRRNIIFRDLKPDNVLLDAEGHAMLTDFGLSKEDIRDNEGAKSFCGSVAYLAPEVLMRQGHGKAVDWYLVGVLMYEMLVGQPPYYSHNKEQLFRNIQKSKLRIPTFVSSHARSLLLQLLQKDPTKRLGSSLRDSEDIKEHVFFYGINWEAAARRELQVPIPPRPSLHLGSVSAEKVYGSLQSSATDTHFQGWSFVSLSVE